MIELNKKKILKKNYNMNGKKILKMQKNFLETDK